MGCHQGSWRQEGLLPPGHPQVCCRQGCCPCQDSSCQAHCCQEGCSCRCSRKEGCWLFQTGCCSKEGKESEETQGKEAKGQEEACCQEAKEDCQEACSQEARSQESSQEVNFIKY